MKAFAALVLALAVVNVRSQVCLTRPGASRLDENRPEGQICGQRNSRTVVELRCNWAEYRFEVTVRPSPVDNIRDVRIEPVDETYHGRAEGRALLGEDTSLNRAVCNNGNFEPRVEHIPFVSGDNVGEPKVKMVIINGQLYYNTSVLVKESYFIDPLCDRYRFLDTPIDLSCCADPLETPPKEIVPPLHQYCELDGCKGPQNTTCGCHIIAEPDTGVLQYVTWCDNRVNLENYDHVGFQLADLHFFPNVAFPPRLYLDKLQVLKNTQLQPLPEHLEIEHPVARYLPRRVTKLNYFKFHANREADVAISARLEYCIHDRPAQPLVPDFFNSFPDCSPL